MKRRLVRLSLGLLLAIALALTAAWNTRLGADLRFTGRAHIPSVDADFSRLPRVAPGTGAKLVQVLRGLPHPFQAPEEFRRELWNAPNRQVAGYRFHDKPARLAPETLATLAKHLTAPSSFLPYTGPKLCGGYHADFAAEFNETGETVQVLVCLGCHEAILVSPNGSLITDLAQPAYRDIRVAWEFEALASGSPTLLPLLMEGPIQATWNSLLQEENPNPFATLETLSLRTDEEAPDSEFLKLLTLWEVAFLLTRASAGAKKHDGAKATLNPDSDLYRLIAQVFPDVDSLPSDSKNPSPKSTQRLIDFLLDKLCWTS